MTQATDPVDDTNHRRNTPPVDSYAPAPEPVESIKQYVLPKGFTVHINGFPVELQHEALIKSGTALPLQKSNDSEQLMLSRLLVQAKLEALEDLKQDPSAMTYHGESNNYNDNERYEFVLIEDIDDEIAALQSQLEGAAGVANDKPVVPPEADSGKGKHSA